MFRFTVLLGALEIAAADEEAKHRDHNHQAADNECQGGTTAAAVTIRHFVLSVLGPT